MQEKGLEIIMLHNPVCIYMYVCFLCIVLMHTFIHRCIYVYIICMYVYVCMYTLIKLR